MEILVTVNCAKKKKWMSHGQICTNISFVQNGVFPKKLKGGEQIDEKNNCMCVDHFISAWRMHF